MSVLPNGSFPKCPFCRVLSKKIDGAKLKPAFGWFVLVMGLYIIIKETFLK
jgi:uncharacterized membrane protein YfcA